MLRLAVVAGLLLRLIVSRSVRSCSDSDDAEEPTLYACSDDASPLPSEQVMQRGGNSSTHNSSAGVPVPFITFDPQYAGAAWSGRGLLRRVLKQHLLQLSVEVYGRNLFSDETSVRSRPGSRPRSARPPSQGANQSGGAGTEMVEVVGDEK